jgi:quinol monooxygenase YgiN
LQSQKSVGCGVDAFHRRPKSIKLGARAVAEPDHRENMRRKAMWKCALAAVMMVVAGAVTALAQAPAAQGGLPPGSEAPSGNWVIAYIEVAPGTEAKALAALKALKAASAKDNGYLSMTVLQRNGQPNHFVVVEHWKDNKMREAHAASAHVKTAREALQAIETAPYDERPHRELTTGQNNPGGSIYAVTHVDFIPTFRQKGEELLQTFAFEGRRSDGNARFDVLSQASRPNHMTIVAVWNNIEAWKRHTAAQSTKDFRTELLPKSGSLYDERLYRVVN